MNTIKLRALFWAMFGPKERVSQAELQASKKKKDRQVESNFNDYLLQLVTL